MRIPISARCSRPRIPAAARLPPAGRLRHAVPIPVAPPAEAVAAEVAVAAAAKDRFGIGWRPDLSAGILAHLDRIDIIEVIADDYFDAPPSKISALRSLGVQVPLTLHGI